MNEIEVNFSYLVFKTVTLLAFYTVLMKLAGMSLPSSQETDNIYRVGDWG